MTARSRARRPHHSEKASHVVWSARRAAEQIRILGTSALGSFMQLEVRLAK